MRSIWTAVLSTTDVHWCSSYLDICMVYYLRIAVSMMNTKCLSLWNTRSAKSNSIFIRCSFGVLQRMFTWLWLHMHIFMLKGLCTFCRTKKQNVHRFTLNLHKMWPTLKMSHMSPNAILSYGQIDVENVLKQNLKKISFFLFFIRSLVSWLTFRTLTFRQ